MKILLINPSLLQATTGQYEEELEKERGVYPPLGLAYIAAVLEKAGHQVKIIDCDVEDNYEEKILSLTKEWQPQIVGFYAMTWSFRLAKNIADKIKLINPKIITVLGGPNVTSMSKLSLELGNFDFGVISEGELTIVELIDKLEGKNNLELEQIKGITFKKNGQIIITPPRPLIDNLDILPFPARHLLPMEKYFDVFSRQKHFATIIATRGCPFNCTFCDRKNRMGKLWRVRSPKNIADEIAEIQAKYGINEFMFFDDNLIVDKNWAYELFDRLKKLNIIWECRERVDLVNEEVLQKMKDAGCYRIRFGFEAGDNNVLKTIKKGITVEQSLACAKACKYVGIEIYGYYIIGAPGETKETIEKTIQLALRVEPSFAIFSKTILIPGTEIFEYAVSTNQISPTYWQDFLSGKETNGAPSLTKEKLSEPEIDDLVKLADRKFYFRPSFIIKKLLDIKSLDHLMSQAKMGMALIFKTK